MAKYGLTWVEVVLTQRKYGKGMKFDVACEDIMKGGTV